LHYKSRLWYWGGAIAILTASLPIAAYFNRNTQSFGKLIGTWVRFRNLFEVSLHVAVAAAAINFFHYYVLLWWIVAYRYLDVGPRRLFQTLYNTPEKRERRPWAPTLNWAVIATLYVLAFLAVYNRKVIYAVPPSTSRPLHVSHTWEIALVGAINIAIALSFWVMIRIYTGVGPAAAELAKDATPTAPDEPQVVAT
jgi:predicted secreted protein